jgi:hypothetical protein
MTPESGWSFELIGLAWWLIIPLAALAGWGMVRLLSLELERLPRFPRNWLGWLRGAAVVVVVLLLLEPTLTRTIVERQLPAVALVVDRSGSMAVTDAQQPLARQMDEAVALGLIDASVRPEGPRRARRELTALITDLPSITASLVEIQQAANEGRQAGDRRQALLLAQIHTKRAEDLADAGGDNESNAFFREQAALLARVVTLLERGRPDGSGDKPETLSNALGELGNRCRALLPKLDAAQEGSDRGLLAQGGPAVNAGLERLRAMSRTERAVAMARTSLAPLLAERAIVSWHALDDGSLTSVGDPAALAGFAPTGSTDFAAPLSTLARNWGDQTHVGAVVLLSDGRQTAGIDPVPAIRALNARGALLAGVAVGDTGVVRDAVVAELRAPPEVFRGETIRLDTRLRITGYDGTDWRLVLTRDGKVVEQRTIKATGSWQTERFELPDAEAGVHGFQARLERAGAANVGIVSGGGLLREVWGNLPGNDLRVLLDHPKFAEGKPDRSETIPQSGSNDQAENTGALIRGYVVPPISGPYHFWITADDRAQLFLATSADPAGKVKIAEVPEYTDPGSYDRYQSQRSAPVVLERGRPYYLEVLHKQGGGGAHVVVGWTLPDQRIERPIPGSFLAPYGKPPPTSVTADQDTEASLANNQSDTSVTVNDDPLRVLIVDHSARWESRFLVDLFERDKRVQVVRRYQSIRQPRGEKELLPPTQQELDGYDIVVLGDLAPGQISAEDQQRLERFVSRRGGFVATIAGPRGMPASYALGGIANLLPVRIVASGGPTTATVQLTASGADHPITSVLDDAALNQKLWPALPPLQWLARGVIAKPGAEVLLASQDERATPVVATMRYGAGRVLWVGTTDTWRWRDRLGDRIHRAFWLQAVRWGLGMRLRGKDDRLQVALDRALIAPRERAELRVRARHKDGAAATGTVHAEVVRIDADGKEVDGTAQRIELAPVADADALWHTGLEGLGEGRWRVTVKSEDAALAELAESRDLVVRDRQSLEGIELGADPVNLSRLAAAGGFRADSLDQAVPLIKDLAERLTPKANPRRTTHSLWDNYLALIVVLTLLAVEWVWRKRVGLP